MYVAPSVLAPLRNPFLDLIAPGGQLQRITRPQNAMRRITTGFEVAFSGRRARVRHGGISQEKKTP
jgi:hypothetical protein